MQSNPKPQPPKAVGVMSGVASAIVLMLVLALIIGLLWRAVVFIWS